MSNLLPIETEFVNNFTHNGDTLIALHRLQDAEGDLKKKQFEKSLAQAPLVRSAVEHFKSEEGQAKLAEAGLTWTYGDFVKKALRYTDRSNANLLIRIAERNEAHPELITKYKREQTRLATAGESAPRSVQHFDKWSRALLEEAEESGEALEDVVEGAEVEATETPSESFAQFRFKHPLHGNIVVNINSDGAVTTTNDLSHVQDALTTFSAMVSYDTEVVVVA
tara:strand:- start:4600 stop:5268 length:669 start_codon:yes stop_codon:yes gene_type:complete